MSGVEVVGVVLGAVPLLISGLEHYGDGIRTIKNMWDYEAVVEHLVIEFRLAHGIFWHSCQELLVGFFFAHSRHSCGPFARVTGHTSTLTYEACQPTVLSVRFAAQNMPLFPRHKLNGSERNANCTTYRPLSFQIHNQTRCWKAILPCGQTQSLMSSSENGSERITTLIRGQ